MKTIRFKKNTVYSVFDNNNNKINGETVKIIRVSKPYWNTNEDGAYTFDITLSTGETVKCSKMIPGTGVYLIHFNSNNTYIFSDEIAE